MYTYDALGAAAQTNSSSPLGAIADIVIAVLFAAFGVAIALDIAGTRSRMVSKASERRRKYFGLSSDGEDERSSKDVLIARAAGVGFFLAGAALLVFGLANL